MVLSDELKRLARLPRSTTPFITLYLNVRWDGEKQRERVRIFVKTRLKECLSDAGNHNGGADAGVREDVDKVGHYVRGLVNRDWDEAYAGVAVFACAELGIFNVVRSHLPFTDELSWFDRPLLRPAVEHAHFGTGGLVAVVAADAGRVLEFELGGVRKQFEFRDEEYPGRHEQGGWSQSRYQRHVDEHTQRNLKRLAGHLVRWADERTGRPILLSGPSEMLAMFEPHLPRRAAERVCARLHADPGAGIDAILAQALGAANAVRVEQDLADVDGLLNQGVGPGRTAVGPVAVSEAVTSGKVHRLFLESSFRERGWKCFGCGSLGIKVPLGCPACGTEVDGVDLGEELIRGTLATDGVVVPVNGAGGLLQIGGVGALLRY